MATIEIRDTIEAPVDKVFDIFADLRNAQDNFEGIVALEVLTEGPIGTGTRWRETRKVMGKESTEEMWFTDWRPGSGYTVECESCGCAFETDLSLTPNGGGTEVVMRISTRPLTVMARMMSPLGFFFMGAFKKCMKKDMDDIRMKLAVGS